MSEAEEGIIRAKYQACANLLLVAERRNAALIKALHEVKRRVALRAETEAIIDAALALSRDQ